jgi:hypothetical protein
MHFPRVIKLLGVFPILSIFVSCTYTFYPAKCDYPISGPVNKLSVISDSLIETSGLAAKDAGFLTFNDSGGQSALYFFGQTGPVVQRTIIENVSNVDWEDIAYDGSSFYIADVGNNFGSRDTLVIYKIPSNEVKQGSFIHGSEKITFSYNEEVSRTDRGYYSHDCEAMLYYRDSLYLFAKDWVTMDTRVYVLPVKPGHYHLNSRASYSVNALITGADINLQNNEVVLVGYKKSLMPVLISYQFKDDPAIIECGGKARKYPMLTGTQFEGVCYDERGRIFISSEKRLYKQALYRAY